MTVSRSQKLISLTEQCPYCYSHDISGDLVDQGGNDIQRQMSCDNCYAEWEITYVANEWEPITEPINPIPNPNRHVVNLRTTSHFVTSSGGN
jgi:transcription elongation factor Elf1